MAEGKATTIRFSTPMYERLEEAGGLTGLPINSIVVVACLEWLDAHQPLQPAAGPLSPLSGFPLAPLQRHWKAPSWRRPVYPFDRFTERAKHALIVAQEEAVEAGQDYIGDEHLLIALAADPDNLAGRALTALGVDSEMLREATQATEPHRPSAAVKRLGLPTSNMKRVIEAAFKAAKEDGAQFVGTPHVLMALLAEPETTAGAALRRLGVSPDQVRSAVERLKKENPQLG